MKAEYDILGRIIRSVESATGTIYEYEYLKGNTRKVTLINENHRSNYKTIKKQILVNGQYIDKEVKELGDKYEIFIEYDFKKEIYFERLNKLTNKIFKKHTVWKNDKPYIWITEYDGIKSVGFYVDKNIIKQLKNGKSN